MAAIADEINLWTERRKDVDKSAHEQLFFVYAPWSRAVAREVYRRVRVPQVEWGDYVHNATVGLLEAMTRFDETRGVDFMGYAKPRVRGSVFNGLRAYLAEYGRREPNGRMQDRVESIEGGGSEDALDQLIASVSGLALGHLLDATAASASRFECGPSAAVQAVQMDALLESAVDRLPEREKLVIVLHYYQHMPFVDISKLLKVTKGRVSQIHKSAVTRMREQVQLPSGGADA